MNDPLTTEEYTAALKRLSFRTNDPNELLAIDRAGMYPAMLAVLKQIAGEKHKGVQSLGASAAKGILLQIKVLD